MQSQEDAQVGTGLQRVLSTSAGHSLSPAALAELRSIAAAKSPSAESPAFVKARASAAVGATGLSEMATILEAKSDSPAKDAHYSEADQLPLAPGLPPLDKVRSATLSLPVPQLCESSTVISSDMAAGAARPALTSTGPSVQMSRDGAPSSRSLPAAPSHDPAPEAAAHGLPAPHTGSKREARRRLAFQPNAAEAAGSGYADGMETLRRTVAVPSDLATLAAGGSRAVRAAS